MSSLDPLEEFYRRDGRPLPRLQFLPPEEIPEPYRSLLVHDRDMTPTLEQFHGGRIVLDLIHRRTEPTGLSREVVLVLSGSRKPVEYGAILIHRAPFPSEAWEKVLACRTPLGTLLAEHQIRHQSCPESYFRVEADSHILGALRLGHPTPLYGRHNRLVTETGEVLADVVEILPPEAGTGVSAPPPEQQ